MIKSGTFTPKNLHYAIIQDSRHDLAACERYIYHGLRSFFTSSIESVPQVTEAAKISDVISAPIFGDYGRLIFPVNSSYYGGGTLGKLTLTWYSNIKPAGTVEIVNYLKEHANKGEKIFYRIYSDYEMNEDHCK